MARQRRGRWFDPELVDVFWAIGDAPSYWETVVDINDPRVVVGWEVGDARILYATSDLLPIAQAFAEIVDAKSPWTHAHSVRTAEYSRRIAERMGLTEGECLVALLAGFYQMRRKTPPFRAEISGADPAGVNRGFAVVQYIV
jgi:response regulator RpfG family c-di-GMP phosphodiesterase